MIAEPMIRIEGVHKSFGSHHVLRGVDLDVAPGEKVVILGRSGSGKTTLLRCINHLETVDVGRVVVDGEPIGYRERHGRLHEQSDREVSRARMKTGMVFQQFNLFPHRTALENVMEGPIAVLKQPRAEAERAAKELLDQVGIGAHSHKYPAKLSGGQQQRVGIARALAMNPKVILFDEPTSALDPELVGEVLETIQRLARTGITMVIVTHEIAFARESADTIVLMHDGVIAEAGPPGHILDNPQSDVTRDFLRHVR